MKKLAKPATPAGNPLTEDYSVGMAINALSKADLLQVIELQTDIVKLGLDMGGVMSLVAARSLSLINADGAAIEIVDGGYAVYRAAAGIAANQVGTKVSLAHSLSATCISCGTPLICDDAELDPRVDLAACRQVGLRSMLLIPLRHQSNTVGVLKTMSRQPGYFKTRDQQLMGLLSDVVGAAMHFAAANTKDALFQRATHDALTGLANRSLFVDRLRGTLARKTREHLQFSVLIVDMDGLKRINDESGHQVGDAALRELAARLSKVARTTDTVARIGGDEFALLLQTAGTVDDIASVATRIDAAIAGPFHFEDRHLYLRASVGAAQFPQDGDTVGVLMDAADRRMYSVKRMHYQLGATQNAE